MVISKPLQKTIPYLSFIIPVKDEEKSIEQLSQEIVKECNNLEKTYEIIFVDDGSVDRTFEVIKDLHKKNNNIKAIRHRRNFGKSAALSTGFAGANGEIVFTLDGDLQDNPLEIPKFLEKLDQGYDLVSGWKKKRYDSTLITLPSVVGNFLIRKLTGVKVHDLNCGFKAYRKKVIKDLNIYGELYRFIPILANQKGYKIGEIVVRHRPRRFGESKYNWFKIIKVFLDLITVLFLTGHATHPGHFFGTLGLIFFTPGLLVGFYITYLRITTGGIGEHYPLMFLGVLLMVIGVQFVSIGLLAEMITSSTKKQYSDNILSELL